MPAEVHICPKCTSYTPLTTRVVTHETEHLKYEVKDAIWWDAAPEPIGELGRDVDNVTVFRSAKSGRRISHSLPKTGGPR
ncbi:MAG: hypothetical protein Q8O67_34370 [Deltaproteobacteria bacterium]|nr:hypothetical protein [Deltaproteobacteria bacterium]